MKIRPYSTLTRRDCWTIAGMVLLMVATGLMAAGPLTAEEAGKKQNRDPIRITADTLVTDNQKKSAQFSGNVKATQGKTAITTDRLTIFYTSKGEKSPSDNATSIERMEADGHVRIEFDNKVAVSNHAVYIVSERKLVLSGPESKVISGQDEISGNKITFFRDSGRVALEGDGKNRVKAIIHSDQRGLN